MHLPILKIQGKRSCARRDGTEVFDVKRIIILNLKDFSDKYSSIQNLLNCVSIDFEIISFRIVERIQEKNFSNKYCIQNLLNLSILKIQWEEKGSYAKRDETEVFDAKRIQF